MSETEVLAQQLRALGVASGDILMVHSSFRSLGIRDPEIIIHALLAASGDGGTLLMPALSYGQIPPNVHSTNETPSCVGFLPEYFRRRPGTLRSVHPTHSACGIGARAEELLHDHIEDHTPCGPHSPFNKLLHRGGKILMIGCGLRPNTTMHAIEEYIEPPYLFGDRLVYTITDSHGNTFDKEYITHGFKGYRQRYDRVSMMPVQGSLSTGSVGQAQAYLIDEACLFEWAIERLKEDPLYFVERGEED